MGVIYRISVKDRDKASQLAKEPTEFYEEDFADRVVEVEIPFPPGAKTGIETVNNAIYSFYKDNGMEPGYMIISDDLYLRYCWEVSIDRYTYGKGVEFTDTPYGFNKCKFVIVSREAPTGAWYTECIYSKPIDSIESILTKNSK